jgi:hypothetical protein
MKNRFVNKPTEALFRLLLNKNKALKKIDIRIGGILFLLLSNELPNESLDVYLYDIVDQIFYYPSEHEKYIFPNNLDLTEQIILESLKRLGQQEILDISHIGGELYRVAMV